MSRFFLVLSAFGLITLASGALWGQELDTERSEISGFELEDLEGNRVELSDFLGSVVVVNFWATWCVPCQQELPFLQQFYEDYEEQGLVILAISSDGPETLSGVRRIARRHRLTMPVLLDQDGSVSAILNPRGSAPFTIFVDRAGLVAFEHEGYSSGDEITYEELIQQLLVEPAPEP